MPRLHGLPLDWPDASILALEKFFDVVNHDILLQCLRVPVNGPVLLKLIGRDTLSRLANAGHIHQPEQASTFSTPHRVLRPI